MDETHNEGGSRGQWMKRTGGMKGARGGNGRMKRTGEMNGA